MNFLRKLFQNKQPQVPPEIQKAIQKVRQDNPQMTARMSDEEIVELMQQADLAISSNRPLVFRGQHSADAQGRSYTIDERSYETFSLEELVGCAVQLKAQGRWNELEQALHVMYKKAGEMNNLPYQAMSLLFLGRIQSGYGNQSAALQLFYEAQDLAQNTSEPKLLSEIYDGIGTAYERDGNNSEAIIYYRRAIEICEQIGDEQGKLALLQNHGNIYPTF